MKRVLVTGAAGFIGFHTTQKLLRNGYAVLGIDNLNCFYNDGLKTARLDNLKICPGFQFIQADITDLPAVNDIFNRQQFEWVIHLAAQAGVRYSIEAPHIYVQSNVAGFVNMIEAACKKGLKHFLFASSSSVYGTSDHLPFSEQSDADHPISLYAATKRSNELIAHVYAGLYGLPVTGLRFFTVYGPWGRPDMAIFKFCKAIYEKASIQVYNQGKMLRDFTYVDDVVEGVVRTMERPPLARVGNHEESLRYRIFNIGNSQPVELLRLIEILESRIGKKASIQWLPTQAGDVPTTYANTDSLLDEIGYRPQTSIEEGIARFVDWYRSYYKVS